MMSPTPPAAQGTPPPRRLLSLDAARGLTIAGMILVNSNGNDSQYPILRHADWNGCTFADVIFPSFLVIMGVSLAISLGRRLERGETRSPLLNQVLWRAAAIFGLGLIMNAALYDAATGLRATGVLQRIALCYLGCALLFLRAGPRAQAAAAAALLACHAVLLAAVGVGSPGDNWPRLLDRLMLGGHLSAKPTDPEGILGTLPAMSTALLGVLAGQWLRFHRRVERKAWGLLAAGAACAAAGGLWALGLPFNKHLWTSSFALWTGGLSLVGLALFYWLAEIRKLRVWMLPLEVFGRNPLLSYFLSGLFYGVQEFVRVKLPDGSAGNVKLWLCARLFGGFSPANASLAYALAYTAVCFAMMAALHRRRLFLKI